MNASKKNQRGAVGEINQSHSASSDLESFLREIVERHTNEPEFHDAVREFMGTVFPEIEGREELSREALLERMVEPDRIFSFRVCWEDDEGRVQVNRGYRVFFSE